MSVRYIRERMPHVPRVVVRVVRDYKGELRRREKDDFLRLN